ncbi:two-component sensor histidine kinase [Paracidovorax avenae]|uniref:ATP-binding protein n=1 Tax=Paracidovorax avenae TaxID=80867 RepID=UPI000D161103|nr:ATP-binding protein [Paracidovorax avenae]AVS70950.1 two-component sensor histidine kinase [Paracidovorax avenae]
MSSSPGLRRQVMLSLGVMALGIILISMIGSYGFYAVLMAYSPSSISDSWVPSRVELAWMLATLLAALAIAIAVAVRLSRRILTPLNAVAESLRKVAQGDLQARATTDDHSMGETAQLVRDFNAMAERLQAMEKQRTFWNAAIAHELRTPVTILHGRLQGLTEGVFEPRPELFQGLLRHVQGLSRLIEDLRMLGLRDSGHLELEQMQADLAQEVASVVHAFGPDLHARGFSVQADIAAPCTVTCDPVRIRQALIALLENVRKHADPGLVRIHARVADGQCHLGVEDEGPGMTEELAAQVFEAFHRGDPTRPQQAGGSGLGLAVVKAIAEAHGGHATCQAAPGGGSVLSLHWPT